MSEKAKNPKLEELEIQKRELDIQKANKEIEKIDLEKEKIELESKELKKGIWKKPQWWALFTTIGVSLITFFTLLNNGTFNSIRVKTEADFSVLKLEKKEFEIGRKDTIAAFEIKKKRMDSLITIKTDSLKNLTSQINLLRDQNTELVNIKDQLNKNLKTSNKLVAEAIFKKQNIERQMNDTVINLTKSITLYSNKFAYSEMGYFGLERSMHALKQQLEAEKYNYTQKLKIKDTEIERLNKRFNELHDVYMQLRTENEFLKKQKNTE